MNFDVEIEDFVYITGLTDTSAKNFMFNGKKAYCKTAKKFSREAYEDILERKQIKPVVWSKNVPWNGE